MDGIARVSATHTVVQKMGSGTRIGSYVKITLLDEKFGMLGYVELPEGAAQMLKAQLGETKSNGKSR